MSPSTRLPGRTARSRRLLAAAAGLAGVLLLSACAADGQTATTATGERADGGTLVYLEPDAFTNLYPPAAGFYPNGGVVNNITDRLVYQNPETLDFEAWIATDWVVNDDATEFTFDLRDDVTFSDGSALDASVVAANFDLFGLGDPDRSLAVSEAVNNYDHSEVVDDDTVTFHFSASSPGFLQATSTITSGLVSADTLAKDLDGFGAGSATEIIGSGPFVVTDEQLGAQLTLSARDDYDWAPASFAHQGRPSIDAVQFIVTPETSVRVGSLISGQGDVARKVEAQDETQVTDAGYTLEAAQTNGVNNSLNLRFREPELQDIRVRQAIIAAVDRDAIVDSLFSDNYPVATSILSQTALGYLDTSEYFQYDPAKAAALLDQAGFTEGSDGIRVKDGLRLSITASEAGPQPRSFDVLTLVAQQLAEVGIELKIIRADAGDFAAAVLDGSQVQVFHSMVGRADFDVIKSQFFSTNRNVTLNLNKTDGSLGDPTLDEVLQAVASEPNAEARISDTQAAQVYLAEQAYVVPLFEEPQVYGIAPYVQDLTFEAVARPSFSQVWLDK
ncbi:TIGR04028 family ABC transporter substrate-binding protein [Cryobacterium melibiosiphilum]|uniref:TIGR04028 family ABC transporter substrate-binding protein n=1 Tax=Cryobacterium melibiosiphilum TaxID=995039 RepID=A0A3A5MJ23_9MICO|nr:TIGR04028 family ABC transporter substrate-binding protein [Cryobacterium melibiosiphilum]RJT88891.1 TIGR04028 family ABC transporter substrate-binding protein [Cryobacterium melibiosiphilum]